jgi:hypothetical protein
MLLLNGTASNQTKSKLDYTYKLKKKHKKH